MGPLAEAPVRLCCGQRHWGAQCPDGLVMCCVCFERFPLDHLAVGSDGRRVDMCLLCERLEKEGDHA